MKTNSDVMVWQSLFEKSMATLDPESALAKSDRQKPIYARSHSERRTKNVEETASALSIAASALRALWNLNK